ncbi:uncharacterized protein J8A68_002112 [[Candida] subhashii]|uniref:Cyclin-like domain-containing protein n=1 Tax=[Candida] subhashii TaxID=561895 RepID=A0A8J5QGS8_9ASCO|nr:uncharacterized protein J8A68_002112 [[Candida] subhashii]KAG7664371.1 hypothetical protein J8A68_002112 [[Candida] subhashii]
MTSNGTPNMLTTPTVPPNKSISPQQTPTSSSPPTKKMRSTSPVHSHPHRQTTPSLQDQTWLFTEDAVLNHSPTRLQKLTIPQELKLKESIHDFLIHLGHKLKLDGATILTTTIYLHRFFMRTSITSSKYWVACAAIVISCKINDCYRPPDKVALIGCNLKNPGRGVVIDEQNEMFWRWRDQLLYREELMLRLLNFDLNVELPYLIRDGLSKSKDEGSGEDQEEEQVFETKKRDILKNATTLIEVLSSLPMLIVYEMKTLFATCLIIIVIEARGKMDRPDLELPKRYLVDELDVDLASVSACFQFLKKLLKYSQQDPQAISNKAAAKRILCISTSTFEEIIKSQEAE